MSLDLVVLVGDQPMPAPGASEVEVIEQIGAPASFAVRAAIPHIEDGPSLLREALLLADHNAYHIGQLIVLRRVLGFGGELGS